MSDKILKYFEGKDVHNLLEFISDEFDYSSLSKRLRILAFISACQGCARFDILRGFIKWAFNEDITAHEVYEVLLQGHLFIGYPRTLESFFVFHEIIDELEIDFTSKIAEDSWDIQLFQKRGLETAQKIYSKNFEIVHDKIKSLVPELASGMIYEGYGRIISRPGLDLLSRELAVVSILTVSDMPRQLFSHIRGAVNVGASKIQIAAAINQCRFLSGDEITARALTILEKSLGNFVRPE